MKTLYLVYCGNGTDLLLSEDEILINNYAESTSEYDTFERTAYAVAGHFGGVIKQRSLTEEHHSIVDDMFEAITPDKPSDNHIAKYVIDNSFVKEFE